jgi:hypothetical protein
MAHKCLACNKRFDHKTGLSNHRRVCKRWATFDGAEEYKKRRLEMQDAEMPGLAQQDDLTLEVRTINCFFCGSLSIGSYLLLEYNRTR